MIINYFQIVLYHLDELGRLFLTNSLNYTSYIIYILIMFYMY